MSFRGDWLMTGNFWISWDDFFFVVVTGKLTGKHGNFHLISMARIVKRYNFINQHGNLTGNKVIYSKNFGLRWVLCHQSWRFLVRIWPIGHGWFLATELKSKFYHPETGMLNNTDGNITKQFMVGGSSIAWFCSPLKGMMIPVSSRGCVWKLGINPWYPRRDEFAPKVLNFLPSKIRQSIFVSLLGC